MEGRAKGLAAPEATWLVGQGLQGLDRGAQPPASLQPEGWAQVCQSGEVGVGDTGLGRQSRLGVLTKTKEWGYELEGVRAPQLPCSFSCLLPSPRPTPAQA